jgi:hypothetical protein
MTTEETNSSETLLDYMASQCIPTPRLCNSSTPRRQMVLEEVTKDIHCHFRKIWSRLNDIKNV